MMRRPLRVVNIRVEFEVNAILYLTENNECNNDWNCDDLYATTWYWSSVSINPLMATIWYCGALIAADPRRISRKESCDDPRAATWRGPWLGSRMSNCGPLARCSIPIIVRECPVRSIEMYILVAFHIRVKSNQHIPWCCKYNGGECTLGSSK